MIAYQKEKIDNAICFFALRHKEETGKNLSQTFLYKYLALFEFEYLKKYGHPPLGLKYLAMERGPVPIGIYEKRATYSTSCAVFKKIEEDRFLVIAKGKPDMDYFSSAEIEEMSRLIKIYADQFVRASDISDASHEEIRAWRRIFYDKKPNAPIDYALEFEGDLNEKPSEKLSPAEESYLIFKALEEAANK